MSLYKDTELGRIRISSVLFTQLIINSLRQQDCVGKVWPATKKGKLIGNEIKYNVSEIAQHVSVVQNEEGNIEEIAFCLIVKFGTSIKKVTAAIADQLAEYIFEEFGQRPDRIVIKISGIKSKQIAKRDLEVMRVYES